MNKTEKLSIIAGSIVTSLICQIWRYKRQKEELEKIQRINKMTEDFTENMLRSFSEPYIKQIQDRGDEAIDDINRRADKALKDLDETVNELRKADFPTKMKEFDKTLTELTDELSKMNE